MYLDALPTTADTKPRRTDTLAIHGGCRMGTVQTAL